MTVRQTIRLIVLTNLALISILVGVVFLAGLAQAQPGAQGGNPPPGFPPVTYQFPLRQLPEDLWTLGDARPNPSDDVPALPNTVYISFAAPSFHPKTSSDGVATADGGSGCIYASDTQGQPTDPVVVSLNLPDGSILTELRVYWWRGGTSDNLNLDLKRTDMFGNVDTPATVSSDADTDYNSDTIAISPTVSIDNANYSYYLNARLNHAGSGLRLCGARVGFTFGQWAAMPLLSKNGTP